MIELFNTVFTRPFAWVLLQIYNLTGSYGVSLIIFTLIARLIMLPFQMKSKKSMMGMQRIQPKLKELEKKYKNDKERYALEVQKLYKDENVSMMGGCLPMLITIPIMFGLYAVLRQPLTFMFGLSEDVIARIAETVGITLGGNVTSSAVEIQIAAEMGKYVSQIHQIVPNLQIIDFNFLGINMAEIPSFQTFNVLWVIPILSGVTSYAYSWIARRYQPAQNEQAGAMNKVTMIMMPLMSVWIAFIVPTGLGFYWIINNLLMIIQEPAMQWYYTKFKPEHDAKKAGGVVK